MSDGGEPNLYGYLKSVSEVAALIGDRIYHQRIPQHIFGATGQVMDCAVFQRVGGAEGNTYCGPDGLVQADYQVDIYSPDDVRFIEVARAIRRALVNYSGPMGEVMVQKVLATNEFDAPEPEPGLYRRTQTYTIWHAES